jgi:hypothetical protein
MLARRAMGSGAGFFNSAATACDRRCARPNARGRVLFPLSGAEPRRGGRRSRDRTNKTFRNSQPPLLGQNEISVSSPATFPNNACDPADGSSSRVSRTLETMDSRRHEDLILEAHLPPGVPDKVHWFVRHGRAASPMDRKRQGHDTRRAAHECVDGEQISTVMPSLSRTKATIWPHGFAFGGETGRAPAFSARS